MTTKFFLVEQSTFRNCNFACTYCSPAGEKRCGNKIQLAKAFANEKRVNDWLKSNVAPSIFKISGNGEITLLDGYETMLFPSAHNIVITNGSRVHPNTITRVIEAGTSLVVQVSLDGNTARSNALRTPSAQVHARIIANVIGLVEAHVPVEINCVLTRQNMPGIEAFLDWIVDLRDQHDACIKLVPLPLRALKTNDNQRFQLDARQIEKAWQVFVDQHDARRIVLPPARYLEHVHAFLQSHHRTVPCKHTRHSLIVGKDNAILPCGCGPALACGSIFHGGLDRRLDSLRQYPTAYCKECFTHSDMINLYLDGQVTIGEIAAMPSYAPLHVQEALTHLRQEGEANHAQP